MTGSVAMRQVPGSVAIIRSQMPSKDSSLPTVTPDQLLPDEMSRLLFEALRPEIHDDYETRTAVCRITLTGDAAGAAGRAATEAVAALPKQRSAQSEQVCVVPPAEAPKHGNRADQRFQGGCLVVQASFIL